MIQVEEYKSIMVFWLDACSYDDMTFGIEQAKGFSPTPVTTVGFLIEENESCLSLAMELAGGNLIRHIQTIPKAIIKNIVYLKST